MLAFAAFTLTGLPLIASHAMLLVAGTYGMAHTARFSRVKQAQHLRMFDAQSTRPFFDQR